MKLQARTIDVLKNFASINQGIIFKPGNRLRTLSVQKNVFAVANIPDEIPREFAVYDLNEFLSTLSLLDDPSVDYKEDHVLLSSGSTKIKYFYSAPAVVVAPPENDINMTDPLIEFVLTEPTLLQIIKSSAALKLKELSFAPGKLVAYNSNNVGNQVAIDVSSTGSDDQGEKVVKIENLKLMQDSYDVAVYERAVKFTSKTNPDLVYFISVESK